MLYLKKKQKSALKYQENKDLYFKKKNIPKCIMDIVKLKKKKNNNENIN